jgi:hypothetical protein
MFPLDHDPPHIHGFGSDFRVKLAIRDARVLETRGTVGPATMRRLRRWALSHRGELTELWTNASRGDPIGKVEG